MSSYSVAVIGGGPAGLMAAETLLNAGVRVHIYDGMPSVGRKFLLAGRGGLNLTHSEHAAAFTSRYGDRAEQVAPWLTQFDAAALRQWASDLGIETFVGTSGRVFPKEMKAAPLLRTWLQRLRAGGVLLHARHRWQGWSAAGDLMFETPEGPITERPDAVVLALGGGSWPRLGSDGAWCGLLEQRGVRIAPLLAANCGFLANWSKHFSEKFAGLPLKSVAMAPEGLAPRRGECMVTAEGLEGGLVYAWSSVLRDRVLADGEAVLEVDLLPQRDLDYVRSQVAWPRGARSWSTHLDSRLGLSGVKLGLLRESMSKESFGDVDAMAESIKRLRVRVVGVRPIEEAISTAGGVAFDGLDAGLMLHDLPGVFCAGEMIDWEAPTGGYLLTACFASGRVAGQGVLKWLERGRDSALIGS